MMLASVPRILRTSRPDRTRSLPNRYLDPGDKHLAVQPSRDLGRICRLKEQLQRLDQFRSRGFDRVGLAREVELGTQSHASQVLPFDDGGELASAS